MAFDRASRALNEGVFAFVPSDGSLGSENRRKNPVEHFLMEGGVQEPEMSENVANRGRRSIYTAPAFCGRRRDRFLFNWLLLRTRMVTTFQSEFVLLMRWMLARQPLFIDELVGGVTSQRNTFLRKTTAICPKKTVISILNAPSRRA